MKKILHITEPFATGVLSFLIDLTKQQVEIYEVYIIYGIRPLTPNNVEELFDKRIHLIKLNSFKGAIVSVINIKAYLDIYKLYNKIKPDIVHFHSSAAGFIGRWVLPCKKIKTFYTPHGFSFLSSDGSKLLKYIYWTIEFFSSKRKSKTIACSLGEYNEALKLSKNCTSVNNGISFGDINPYVFEKFNLNNPITICTSGRILYMKNPVLFNKIAELLPNINFIWIGDGESKKELSSSNILVTGWVSRTKVLQILSNSDFFILPSYSEGLSISLLEAMYLKKICLVSDIEGNRNVIQNYENGIICQSVNDYVHAIEQVISGDIDGRILAERAHKDVKNEYGVIQMAQKYSEIYEKEF
jgi:glycosyltransferase involved in cell wall biosynthesis